MIGYDLIGDIAIVKFDRNESEEGKKQFALDFLQKNKNIKTILEKTDKIDSKYYEDLITRLRPI